MHDTGPALAGVTADMGTGQIQILAQEMDKEGPVLDIAETALPFTVNLMVDTRDTSRCFYNYSN